MSTAELEIMKKNEQAQKRLKPVISVVSENSLFKLCDNALFLLCHERHPLKVHLAI